MTLVEFLIARLDEDEAAARRLVPGRVEPRHGSWGRDSALLMHLPVEERRHIARHDPARVLAEVDAKRRIVARLRNHAQTMGEDMIHSDILRLLALPYADHPDYQQEWKP